MCGLHLGRRVFAAACLALLVSDAAYGQKSSKKPSAKTPATKAAKAKTSDRPRTVGRDAPASDRIVLRDGKELLGQVEVGGQMVVARRDWLRANLPDRMAGWEEAERKRSATAREQR